MSVNINDDRFDRLPADVEIPYADQIEGFLIEENPIQPIDIAPELYLSDIDLN